MVVQELPIIREMPIRRCRMNVSRGERGVYCVLRSIIIKIKKTHNAIKSLKAARSYGNDDFDGNFHDSAPATHIIFAMYESVCNI